MTINVHNSETTAAEPPTATSERAEAKKFFAISAAFLAGFVVVALAVDHLVGVVLHRSSHRGGIGPDAVVAMDHLRRDPGRVRAIFLGDSVARQLFRPGKEPSTDVRFATTNAAISMAGQCYLAEAAMRACPNLREVYLFYLPAAWVNNLPRDFSHDYFCAHFHSAGQVAEVFAVKRDVELSLAHAGRWFVPNLMIANSLSQPAFSFQPQARQERGPSPLPPDPERLLTSLSALMGPREEALVPEPPGRRAVVLSPVSRYYLAKLREDCRWREIRLHVLPCPVSQEKTGVRFVDEQVIYEGPMIQDIPAAELIDAVHFKSAYVAAARRRVIELYRLEFLKAQKK